MKTLKFILCIMLAALLAVSAGGCLKYTSNILEMTGSNVNTTNNNTEPSAQIPTINSAETTTGLLPTVPDQQSDIPTGIPSSTSPVSTAPVNDNTTVVSQEPTTAAAGVADPATWNKTQILQNLTTAINKTKAFVGNVSVKHNEEYHFDITECPGGSVVLNIVNGVVANVVKPSDETLNFSGGKAVDSEGKTVVILLPQKQNFALPESGLVSASAKKSGNNTVITVTLVSEVGTLTTPPKYNALGTGYIDASSLDISAVKINSFDVTYTGSVIVATINSAGYVVNCNYKMPFDITGSGSVSFANGTVKANGYMQENWAFNW